MTDERWSGRRGGGRFGRRRSLALAPCALAVVLLVGGLVWSPASAAAAADLAITKTDGVTTATAGGTVTYTITASNAGPSSATGVTVADTFPASLTATWACVGAGGGTCTAEGSGNINDSVNLPAGGLVTYTATASISAAASGTLSNTATVTAPGGVTDSNPANNSATDTDTIASSADLSVTKTDGVTTATAGGSVTYTITASNAGPSNASGATVADTLPAVFENVSWTCDGAGGGTCTDHGNGNLNDTVNLPAGGTVTYTVTAGVSASASGTVSNTATVSAPAGVTDPSPVNNSATDTDSVGASADLSVTKTDGVTSVTAGGSTTYTITASNSGPSDASGATVGDVLPATFENVSWTCVGAGGGTCTDSHSGNINDTVNLPVGASVTYTVSADVKATASGTVSNTATVAAPGGVTDGTPGNNSATDTDTIGRSADLSITKTDGVTSVPVGGSTTYTITASNAGLSDVSGATVTDTLPAGLEHVSWTCEGAGGGDCAASGTGDISDTVDLPVDGTVTYTVNADVAASASGTLANTATVAVPGGVLDPAPGNNSATDVDSVDPVAPAAPTVTGSTPSAGAVSVAFTPGEDGGSTISAYTAECVSTDGGTTRSATGSESPISVTGLSGDKSYHCHVLATNDVGDSDFSAFGDTVLVPSAPPVATEPTAPTVTGSLPSSGAVTVTFTAGGDGGSTITGFTVECLSTDGGATGTATGTASPISVTGLTAGASYHCHVRATNSTGDGPYSGFGETVQVPPTATAPAAPTVTGSTPAAGAVSVAFTSGDDGGSPVTGFTAECVSTDGGAAGTGTGSQSPVSVTGLTSGKSYHCHVKATNAVGESAYSAFGETVLVPPTATVPGAPTIKHERATSRHRAVVRFVRGSTGGSPITSYQVTCTSRNGGATGHATGTSRRLVVKHLTPGKTYRCTVSATNSVGTSDRSAPGKRFTMHLHGRRNGHDG